MQTFLNGVSAGGSFVAGLLFFRFWRDSGDRLFFWFGFAFWMFAANWSAISVIRSANEAQYVYFVPRLIGFVLILIAIFDKNRRHIPRSPKA
jgi:hypothetical protein